MQVIDARAAMLDVCLSDALAAGPALAATATPLLQFLAPPHAPLQPRTPTPQGDAPTADREAGTPAGSCGVGGGLAGGGGGIGGRRSSDASCGEEWVASRQRAAASPTSAASSFTGAGAQPASMTQRGGGFEHSPQQHEQQALGTSVRLRVDPPSAGAARSDAQLYELQGGGCSGCGAQLPALESPRRRRLGGGGGGGAAAGPRRCHYLDRLFCHACHDGSQRALIPARVLHDWDFSQAAVCLAAAEYLASIRHQPMLCVGAVNPGLYAR